MLPVPCGLGRSTHRLRALVLVAAWLVMASGPRLACAGEPVTLPLGTESLQLRLPDVPGLERGTKSDEQCIAYWWGTFGASEVMLEVRVFPREDRYVADPEDVLDYIAYVLRHPDHEGDPAFAFEKKELIQGKFGWVPYAGLATGPIPSAAKATGEVMVLGAVLEKHAYTVRIYAKPKLEDPDRAKFLEFLSKGVTGTSPLLDTKWTAQEIESRWKRDLPSPAVRAAMKPPVRTKHYIIFTNSGAGSLFAKKMESCYEQIQQVYPFPEGEWKRLLPIFIFKDVDEYYAYGHKLGMKGVSETKGHAWKDYYATYYDSPNDPVHIHEATHQLFRNRLHLSGGGSWFQEGVAEYMCTQPGERKTFAKSAARSGKFCKFRTFVGVEDLISGASPLDGYQAYTQAASLIELLRDTKKYAPKFQQFVHEMGTVAPNDAPAIEARIQALYGEDLDALEAAWVKYWSTK